MFEKVLAKLEALEPLIKATGDENIKALSGGKDCIVSLTVRRNGTGKYSDEYSMYLMLIKVRFE